MNWYDGFNRFIMGVLPILIPLYVVAIAIQLVFTNVVLLGETGSEWMEASWMINSLTSFLGGCHPCRRRPGPDRDPPGNEIPHQLKMDRGDLPVVAAIRIHGEDCSRPGSFETRVPLLSSRMCFHVQSTCPGPRRTQPQATCRVFHAMETDLQSVFSRHRSAVEVLLPGDHWHGSLDSLLVDTVKSKDLQGTLPVHFHA